FGVGEAVLEAERVARPQVGEPLLETILVEQLANALARRQIEVVIAFGADVEAAFGFLAKDGGLAAGALNPQPLRHATLRPFAPAHGGSGVTRFHAAAPTGTPLRHPALSLPLARPTSFLSPQCLLSQPAFLRASSPFGPGAAG